MDVGSSSISYSRSWYVGAPVVYNINLQCVTQLYTHVSRLLHFKLELVLVDNCLNLFMPTIFNICLFF